MEIELRLIKPSPKPVRTTWDEDKMQELAQSIREQGVIVPIKVRPIGGSEPCPVHGFEWIDGNYERYNHESGYSEACRYCVNQIERAEWDENDEDEMRPAHPLFEIVYGHRRAEAARRAGLEAVPVIVEGVDDTSAMFQALIENIQREDMSDLDQGRAFKALRDDLMVSGAEISRRMGVSRQWVNRCIRLVDDPVADILSSVQHAGRGETHAPTGVADRADILSATLKDDIQSRRAVAEKTMREDLPRSQMKQVAEAVRAAPTPELKRKLIETPYNPILHNAETVREVAKYPDRPRNQATGFEWGSRPEVAAILEALKLLERRCADIEDSLPEWKRTADIGKFSPEAVPFFVSRLRRTSNKLATTSRRLVELGEWIEHENG
jgi:ParB-like chromosome segregation protein Spo0J